MSTVELIDQSLLDACSAQALASARGRKNHNFHGSTDDACNRLLNAIEPGSYVQPHQHAEPTKDETMVVLRGMLGLVVFDDSGRIVSHYLLRAASAHVGVNIPHGTWHTVVALEAGTIFFEAKAGPYRALDAGERAAWAPAEGSPESLQYLARWRALFAQE
jgi:cupin fold WbuC family metalloprotein